MERNSGLLPLSTCSCVSFLKVECGYQVFLECPTVDAEIFYTTDGSYPADCNAALLVSTRITSSHLILNTGDHVSC